VVCANIGSRVVWALEGARAPVAVVHLGAVGRHTVVLTAVIPVGVQTRNISTETLRVQLAPRAPLHSVDKPLLQRHSRNLQQPLQPRDRSRCRLPGQRIVREWTH